MEKKILKLPAELLYKLRNDLEISDGKKNTSKTKKKGNWNKIIFSKLLYYVAVDTYCVRFVILRRFIFRVYNGNVT